MKQYSFREKAPASVHEALEEYPVFLRELLFSRGVTTGEKAKVFLKPAYERDMHDPFLLKNMEKAVLRILWAIQNNERIAVYTDYDHDGGPGGVLFSDTLRAIHCENFTNYIPHRHKEGYGLNTSAVEKLAEDGVKLIITIDCGITDTAPVARGNELGVDTIITDHHLVPEHPPEAFTIINPKQEAETYPFNGLCGAGLAWKLSCALIKKGNFTVPEGFEKWLLDLAGLSTIADMVPLQGENRAIAFFGLKVLRKSRRAGLRSLYRVLRIDPSLITEDDVGFSLAPRINAASRMDDPYIAFDLLSEKDPLRAGELAQTLNKLNESRKGLTASMVKEMKHTISAKETSGILSPIIVLGNPSWRPGLLGLAANTLVETYERPAFLWGREGGETLKGSCRSWGGINVVELMRAVTPGIFLEFGGHKFSGGFSLLENSVHHLEENLSKAFERLLQTGEKEEAETRTIDAILSLDEVGESLASMLDRLSPFGAGNEKPLFYFENVFPHTVRFFGTRKEHLELLLKKQSGETLRAISFFASEKRFSAGVGRDIEPNTKYAFVAHVERSHFGGRSEIRLRIVDICD